MCYKEIQLVKLTLLMIEICEFLVKLVLFLFIGLLVCLVFVVMDVAVFVYQIMLVANIYVNFSHS